MSHSSSDKLKAKIIFTIFYTIATVVAWLVLKLNIVNTSSYLLNLYLANLSAAFTIYLFCILCNSFTVFDPYWSIECIVFAIYYYLNQTNSNSIRVAITVTLVIIWASRLVIQLMSELSHFKHEDWRYSDFGKKLSSHGFIYFLFGLLTFIILPTTAVYFGCAVPLYYLFYTPNYTNSLNIIDFIGFSIVILGILFEAIGDYQLRSHLKNEKINSKSINTGLWSLCRHPNYFGELSFWFGLYLIPFANNTSLIHDRFYLCSFIFGAFTIFSIIYFGSLPMMEERQLKRRKDTYTKYMQQVKWKLLPLNFNNTDK